MGLSIYNEPLDPSTKSSVTKFLLYSYLKQPLQILIYFWCPDDVNFISWNMKHIRIVPVFSKLNLFKQLKFYIIKVKDM